MKHIITVAKWAYGILLIVAFYAAMMGTTWPIFVIAAFALIDIVFFRLFVKDKYK